MPFQHNTTGVEVGGGSRGAAPAGVYILEVKEPQETKSKRGNDMVKMKVAVAEGPHKGKWCFANVTFLSPDEKGSGISKNWLKVLKQPYEGNVVVNANKWAGVKFKGRLSVVQNEKNGRVYDNNEIGFDIWALDDESAPDVGPDFSEVKAVPKAFTPAPVDDSEVPF